MTGAEHFEKAEDFLQAAKESGSMEAQQYLLKVSDIHSTLAHTAAILESARWYPVDDPR